MSTSSQGAESTPSANSVLSESSLVLQSGDILPEAGLNEAEASGNVYQGMEFKSQAPKQGPRQQFQLMGSQIYLSPLKNGNLTEKAKIVRFAPN